MSVNSEIYLFGLAILIFLIITFLFIKKVSNDGKLKVKIEKVQDSSDLNISDEPHKNQQSFDFDINQSKEQELVILNLISMDRSMFDMDQLFGFLSIYGAKTVNNYFAFYQDNKIEKFRVINALKPGTFEDETKSFAIAVVSDLNVVDDPLNTVKQMIEFSINFAEKFYATLCDQDRTPITKQMISHIESRAQDIARLKQLNISDMEK
jgi:FtsZ-interacting cell division protein ZipA